jgi:ABC-2 type transport system ATP-binding protein
MEPVATAPMKPLVEVQDLSIGYRQLGVATRNLKTELLRSSKKLMLGKSHVKVAVSNVSFTLSEDEILGVIGRNGAGKSSLVKALSGVIKPMYGHCITRGRVSSLIELGGAFNHDLNAFQNIRMFYLLNGLDKKIAADVTDEILHWAELSEVRNDPLFSYSSGMLARFAFSVATSIKPKVLILDEILSVGDVNFADKSRRRILDLIGSGSATVLVSHDLNLLQEMCSKILWLEKGTPVFLGNPGDAINNYRKFMMEREQS